MMRRIQRCLSCYRPSCLLSCLLGLGVVAALLLPALPMQADEIEPEPDVEETVAEPEPKVVAEPEAEAVAEPEAEAEPDAEAAEASEAAEESDRNIEKFLDLAIVRPLYFARLVVGLPFFVFYPFTLASGLESDVVSLLWTEPYAATFERPLGEAPEEAY
jgi:hypothetical protein